MAQQQPAPKQTLQMDPGAGSVDTEFSHDETPIHENGESLLESLKKLKVDSKKNNVLFFTF